MNRNDVLEHDATLATLVALATDHRDDDIAALIGSLDADELPMVLAVAVQHIVTVEALLP